MAICRFSIAFLKNKGQGCTNVKNSHKIICISLVRTAIVTDCIELAILMRVFQFLFYNYRDIVLLHSGDLLILLIFDGHFTVSAINSLRTANDFRIFDRMDVRAASGNEMVRREIGLCGLRDGRLRLHDE